MKAMMTIVSLAAGALFATASLAQAPAGAPAGATGQCKDGTYWTGASKSGACSGHKGVQTWFGTTAAAAPAAAPAKVAPAAVPAKAAPTAMASGSAPAGATGLCKDGTYWTGASKSGACSGHKGVQAWYGAAPVAAAPAAVAPPVRQAAPAPSYAPAPAAVPAPAAPSAAPAPGGGAGLVWLNPSSKTYHCPGDKWYGKTKSGQYVTEQQAVASGYHPDHGKACSR